MREVSTREGELLAGKYQLEKRLAAGGMGEVYRATNTAIGRTVAIKLLLAEHARNDTLVARFMTEARAANLVRHPNVVDVLDVGKADDGTPFIVQELLEGHDLGQHIVEFGGRLPATAVIELMAPIVEAIGVAHAAGVVHRDLKPENVFLARVGNALVPKLLDFGISQVISAEPSVRLTATGTAMGTPTYMSPEQVTSSKLVDARTDVWALGVILYELLAGELPFKGETPGAMFVKIATEEATPLDQLAPHVPAALVKIVGRCMQKKREMRYATANELARDMKAVLEGRLPEPSKSGPLAGLPAIAAQHVHSREAAMETASALRVELPTDPFAGLEVRSPPAVPSPRRSGADDIAIASSPLGVGEPSGGHVELDAGDDVSAASGL
jgi:serine/threonine-protein kinase